MLEISIIDNDSHLSPVVISGPLNGNTVLTNENTASDQVTSAQPMTAQLIKDPSPTHASLNQFSPLSSKQNTDQINLGSLDYENVDNSRDQHFNLMLDCPNINF